MQQLQLDSIKQMNCWQLEFFQYSTSQTVLQNTTFGYFLGNEVNVFQSYWFKF